MTTANVEDKAPTYAELFGTIRQSMQRAIKGKDDVIDLTLLCLVAGGHLLVEDVPGVGKTTLAKALAHSVDCTFGRVQFTPDLLPSDVVGVTVWNRQTGAFDFRPGPIFSHILLGDEINRASPKTQSALLEAMGEEQVTVDGTTYRLQAPFMVLATQNPAEHEGTYPLPESQLDRFLMRISMGYPSRADELQILSSHGTSDAGTEITAVADLTAVRAMAAAARSVHVAPAVQGYLVDLAEQTRNHRQVVLGMSPRATLSLQRVARARAAALGRVYVTPDDIKALAIPVVAHRLVLTPEAQVQGVDATRVLGEVIRAVPVPTAAA